MLKPIKGLRKLARRVRALLGSRPAPRREPAQPRSTVETGPLKATYRRRGLHTLPDDFVLYRIVGNDLYPRHSKGAARANVQFILENEPPLEGCHKRWLLNRIVDPAEEAAIVALLERHGQSYFRIPFAMEEYAEVAWELDWLRERELVFGKNPAGGGMNRIDRQLAMRVRRGKNAYAMNNNGARNAALRAGRGIAKWVLPWDGNCFVTAAAWNEIRSTVCARPYYKYFIVPMARVVSNHELLQPDCRPQADEEPQVLFRCDAAEEFDPAYVYGRRSKISLFWRLGVPGVWDDGLVGYWDPPRPNRSPEAGQFAYCGWVARLTSGHANLEVGDAARAHRSVARVSAIVAMLDHLDQEVLRRRFEPGGLAIYSEDAMDRLRHAPAGHLRAIAERIETDAAAALERGLHSVVDKTTLPPSGDPHDYWHPAPSWWPNPASPDGLPYVCRAGERRPGAELRSEGSEQFDRTRLQLMIEDATACAVAWRITGRQAFAEHGARLVRRWFLEPGTRMNPHLRFAQVRMGYDDNEGTAPGIVEMRDLPLLLDAARLLARSGALPAAEVSGLQDWMRAYRDWLTHSRQGRKACRADNNVGTYFELQWAAISAYLADLPALSAGLLRARNRIVQQFDPDGSQPYELVRNRSLHYCCFNLQGWLGLTALAARCGDGLGAYRSGLGSSLRAAIHWLESLESNRHWPYPQSQEFDWRRVALLRPQYDAACARASALDLALTLEPEMLSSAFSTTEGFRLYWYL